MRGTRSSTAARVAALIAALVACAALPLAGCSPDAASHRERAEQYLAEDRARMCEVIRQTPKTCLAFKILAASRNCATQSDVRAAFQYAFSHIKPQDAVVVGMYPKHVDQVALNVQHTLHAIHEAESQ